MIGCEVFGKTGVVPEWVAGLLCCVFFDLCLNHEDLRKNERNIYCIDCKSGMCRHCVTSSDHDSHHHLLQICKYVYHDVVRLQDIQKHLDCSKIQAYKINGEKAVHLNPRPHPQLKDSKTSKPKGAYCEACQRHLQDLPNRFCSIACKVSIEDASTNININVTSHHANDALISSAVLVSRDDLLANTYRSESRNDDDDDEYDSWFSLTPSSDVINESLVGLSFRKITRKGVPRRAPLL